MNLATSARIRLPAPLRRQITVNPCAYCGEDYFPRQVDHIVPLSRGGTNEPHNLTAACASCNGLKLDFTPDEFREWHEAEGYGWPPRSRTQRIIDAIAEFTGGTP